MIINYYLIMNKQDRKVSVPFYQEKMGMTLIDHLDFPDMKFSLDFLGECPGCDMFRHSLISCLFAATIPDEQKASLPKPGTEEAHKFLWGFAGTTLELT